MLLVIPQRGNTEYQAGCKTPARQPRSSERAEGEDWQITESLEESLGQGIWVELGRGEGRQEELLVKKLHLHNHTHRYYNTSH